MNILSGDKQGKINLIERQAIIIQQTIETKNYLKFIWVVDMFITKKH